jgi:hypothetical protein
MLTKHNPWGEPFGDVVELPAAAKSGGRRRSAATGVAQKGMDRTHVDGLSK